MRHLPLLTCALLAASGSAQQSTLRPMAATRATSVPVIDGRIDDDLWKGLTPVTGFYDNMTAKQVADQTLVRVAYDDKYIYAAFEMLDPNPGEIGATETQEDYRFNNSTGANNEDVVDIRIDTFSTGTFGGSSVFSVNAIGTKSASLGGGRAKKTEWKGAWTAAVSKTATGWTAEMRIPWSILNYPAKKGPQNMGINFFRYQKRLKLPSYWADIGPNEREELQGIWQGVETPAPPAPKASILPYVIGGIDENGGLISRTGLDARIPLGAQITAVGSLNPDFGTVEGAVDSVGYSRSERFLPERRPFFMEGQRYFQAGMGFDIGQFFYPRRIASFDLGTKIFGTLNPKDSVGVLQTTTFGERNDLVANWSHQESPKESYGVFANLRSKKGDEANVVSGNYSKEWGKLAVNTRYAHSNDRGKTALASSNSIWYQDKSNMLFFSYNDTNDAFRLPDGLLPFKGYRGWEFVDEFSQDWRTGPVQAFRAELSASYNDDQHGKPFQRGGSASTSMAFRNDWGLGMDTMYYDWAGLIDRDVTVRVTKGVSNRFSKMYVTAGGGTLEGDKSRTHSYGLSQRIAKGLDVGLSHFHQDWRGTRRESILTVAYELSPTRSFGGRIVSQDKDTNWYLSFRNAGKAGTEYFVVLGDPNARKFRRMIQFKAVFAF